MLVLTLRYCYKREMRKQHVLVCNSAVCVVMQVWNGEESEQMNTEKEHQSEAVPELIVEAQYGEEVDDELCKKVEALTLQKKGV